MAGTVAQGSDKEAGQRPNTKRSGSELSLNYYLIGLKVIFVGPALSGVEWVNF
jgi:hypothetical protein